MGSRKRLLLPKTGCRERACAGSGRPELFIDAISKSKSLHPGSLCSAAMGSTHWLSGCLPCQDLWRMLLIPSPAALHPPGLRLC